VTAGIKLPAAALRRASWACNGSLNPALTASQLEPPCSWQARRGHHAALQVTDPRGASNGKWDCFASYRLALVHPSSEPKTIARDSWHRFSGKKKSHGWCDFAPAAAVLDPQQGFSVHDSVVVSADILVLNETVTFTREAELASSGSTAIVPVSLGAQCLARRVVSTALLGWRH
jgi:hypothetical protein